MDVVTEARDGDAHRPRQRNDVPGIVLGNRNCIAARIHDHAGEVARLVEHRRIRHAGERGAHLAHDGDETLLDDLQGDRIDHVSSFRCRW